MKEFAICSSNRLPRLPVGSMMWQSAILVLVGVGFAAAFRAGVATSAAVAAAAPGRAAPWPQTQLNLVVNRPIGRPAAPSASPTAPLLRPRTRTARTPATAFALHASLLDAIGAEPEFSTFRQLIDGVPDLKALLGDESYMEGGGNIFTVFCPTNQAFKALTKDQAFKLGKKENLPILRKLVRFHVHQELGPLSMDELGEMVGRELSTLALLPVTVRPVGGGLWGGGGGGGGGGPSGGANGVKLNEARVVRELDICSNGKLYEVDAFISSPLIFRFLV